MCTVLLPLGGYPTAVNKYIKFHPCALCFLHFKSISCTHLSLPTLHIYLLYSHNTSYTSYLPPVITYHFLHSKSNSCTHISLPTLQIYFLYSHITSYTPYLPPVLTYHFLNSLSTSCTHIPLPTLHIYLL